MIPGLAPGRRRVALGQRKPARQSTTGAREDIVVVQAYILIQTEVGKAADVAREIAEVKGVTMAEDVTGPYDVIVRAEARNVDELGKLVVARGAGRRRHHAYPDLPCGSPLTPIPTTSTRPQPTRPLRAALGAAIVLILTSGCTADSKEPVSVTAPNPTGPGRAQCQHLVDELPTKVDGLKPRGISPARALARAWGSPPAVLRCGVPQPAGLTAVSQCTEVDGVGWFAQSRAKDVLFTTIGRSVNVELKVPNDYRPQANALVDVAAAVKATTTNVRPCV